MYHKLAKISVWSLPYFTFRARFYKHDCHDCSQIKFFSFCFPRSNQHSRQCHVGNQEVEHPNSKSVLSPVARALCQSCVFREGVTMNLLLGLLLLSCIRLCVTERYVLDDRIGLGRRFDGIGGLSGGGVGYLWTHTCFLISPLLFAWIYISSNLWRFAFRLLRDFWSTITNLIGVKY